MSQAERSQADELAALGLDVTEAPELLPDEEERWLTALEVALRPTELSATEHERLLSLALEDPFAPPSDEELIESARLRDALEGAATHEDAALLAALRAPFAAGDATVPAERQLEPPPATAPNARRNVLYVAFGSAGLALAAAAAVVLALGTLSGVASPDAASAAAWAKPRSTAPLFAERFDADTTARVDLIASARTRDLRDNRYAAWGVR